MNINQTERIPVSEVREGDMIWDHRVKFREVIHVNEWIFKGTSEGLAIVFADAARGIMIRRGEFVLRLVSPTTSEEHEDTERWVAECSCGWQSIPCTTNQSATAAHCDHNAMPPLSLVGPHILSAITGITPPTRGAKQVSDKPPLLPALDWLSPGERAAAHEALLKGRAKNAVADK